ncbi:T1SS-143 repeat domain-containing protein, partial [Photobacterium iliopiscarium]
MVKNNNKIEEFKLVDGDSFILKPNQQPIPVTDLHALQTNEIIVTNRDAKFILIKDGVEQVVNLPCSSCSILTPDGVETVELDDRITFNGDAKEGTSFSIDDITALQNAILSGQDPTALFEAPAAGNESAAGNVGLNGSSATASFITINYDNNTVLAEAGFDTTYDPNRTIQSSDTNVILAADGGELGSMTLVEGDLFPSASEQGYPVQTSISIIIDAATLPLESASFIFDSLSINTLLFELNNEISSGGQAVSFVFDTQSNAIVGTLNGTTVMSITLDASSANGRDVTVNITTIINQPIDHSEGNGSGLVSRDGDSITVDVAIQGADSNGNLLDQPINVDITIKDGVNPEFGIDNGTNINETTQNGQIVNGDVPLDIGSDDIQSIHFNAAQDGLANITSNGEATTFTVNGNVLTVIGSNSQPVMVVTIANDGTYTVKVTGAVDQNSADIADIKLAVTATDKDGDTAQGELNITINDGTDAVGGENIDITLTEGDRDVDGSGTSTGGIDTTYPVEQSGQLTLVAGEDRLDPNTVAIDASQQADLIKELNAELTSGGHALTFTVDANGNLVGTLAGTDTVAVRVELTPQQDGQNVNVEVKIIQELPLDHKDSGNGTYVSVDGDDIAIKVPVQAQDTDGDPLDNPATIDITIKDGANPVFGIDSGISINETTEADKIIAGQIPLDVGSDDIQSIHFNAAQEGLANITSNGEATTYNVNGNVLTVVDAQSQPVMVVTIANDGTYTVKVTGAVDQNSADIAEIKLAVTATDKDGDSANGELNITINDGSDAVGGENIDITLTEGDRDVDGSGTSTGGIDTTYPVEQSGQLTLVAGEDRLVASSAAIDVSQQASLIKELNAELTSGGHALTFTVDANGNLVGTLAGTDTVAVRVELTPTQDGQNVNVEVKIIQELPLDHNVSGDSAGFVTVNGNDIAIKVPVQAKDTDGDPLDNAATIDITIKDGANPVFGIDSGITINETTEADKIIAGQIPLDVGSDDIQSIHFNAAQDGLANITSNGEATTYNVNGNVLTVVDTQSQPVMVVTIANNGTYTVKVTGPVDQNSADIAEIKLAVTATDNDGDTARGELNITINDGSDAVGGENIDITLTEGDRDVDGSGSSTGGVDTSYPVEQSGQLTLVAGEDRLDPNTVAIDVSQQAELIKELNAELTSSGHALTFTVDVNGNLVGTLVGTDTVAVRVELTPQQDGQNVNVDIKIIQALPLDHNASGDSAGFVTVNGNDIAIKVPVQAQDTDGDPLDNPATIDITIKDGANPIFGIDSGTTITETETGVTATGKIPLDVGSDDIQSLHFNAAQEGLANITSNGEATTFTVNGNVLTVIGSNSQPVMVVTIANDGTYTVKVTGPVDQNSADIAEIKLAVTATDKDGDTAQGELNITINDGSDAVGGENIDIKLTEGDRDVDGSGTSSGGIDTTYPVEQSGQLTLVAGEDRLDPHTVAIDASQQAALIKELNAELTSSGQALTFTVDANGNLVGTLAGTDTVAVRVELTPQQDGQNVNVEVKIIQELPLDHKDSGNGTYVSVDGDDIAIKVPVQAKDTDGDPLDNPATIDITIKDGANPVFGIDSGITINETTEADKIIVGQIPLDVGSDDIQSIHFNAAQDGLANITSNGEATTYNVNGNVLTVVDAQSQPVMVVTIANDGTYTVKVTGAVDQNSADIAEIKLAVTATDKDGDTAQGELNITINDGTDAVGGENIDITLTEGDRDVDGSGTSTGGVDTTYPVEQSGQLTLVAGEDRLDPNTVAIDASQQAGLIKELNTELTSGGHALTFTVDANGNLVGTLAGTDTVAVRVELTPQQDGQNVNIEVKIIQELPLDHKDSGNGTYVSVDGDDIAIKVPVQAKDTDGDPLDNAATIDITIKDGANPVFGIDSGTSINETTEADKIIAGQIPLDVGSDDIQSLHFNAAQGGLANITSNGEATTYNVNGNVLTVVDAQSQPVMVVTIANDGTYTVKVTGPVDQNSADIADIKLAVTATDKDGDTANGELNITINDGSDAVGGENIDITLTEGDRDVDGSGTSTGGIDTTYPVEQSGQLTLVAGEDRLVASSAAIDASQQADLIKELNAELTSSGHALTFTVDANGNLVGTLVGTDTVAVRVELTPTQDGQNVNVDIKIIQALPLDHNASGNSAGFVTVNGNDIAIKVPVQAKDTDGDPLDNPATIDITIKDGANPVFGIDSSITINETTEADKIIAGQIPFDVGSDDIQSIHFNAAQDGLANITSNGEATTFTVNGNVLTVVDAQSQPVMVVTIANDGTYTVKVTGPVDQNSADIADIKLAVTATDKDGDTAQGELNITINDGIDAVGGENIDITLTEGDRDVDGSGTSTGGVDTTYPVEQSGQLTLVAGEDRLDPNTVAIDASQQADLIKELNAELTSSGHALTFTVDANGNLVGTLAGTDTVAVRVELTPTQDGQNVNVEVKIIQELPLDHKDSGNGTYVSVDGDDIAIKVPVQAKDTDGDPLDNPATIDITIKDGANPIFGIDSGTTITETETGVTATGKIPLDVGSDDIQSLHFNAAQEGLANITSNGEATTFTVNGNVLTVIGSNSQPVMVVTIANDGTYTVKVTGPVDQNSADIAEIKLAVTATDKDGDSAHGELNITINDGTDAVGGENIDITLTEGDRDVDGSGTSTGGIDTTYPVEQSGQLTLVAGEDRLDPNTVAIDASQQAALIKELNAELTSSGQALTFTVDANGNLVGTLAGTDTVAVRVELTPQQDGQNVNIEVKIIQELPLDHKDSSNGTYVSVDGDDIAIKVPVQAKDTDGDPLDNPATIDITIKDGANPVFGIDSGTIINETTEADKIIAGQIPLDVGSDDIQSIHFNAAQDGLANITSNGEATTYNVNGNVLTVIGSNLQPVMVVTIANDGTYTVKVTGPVDQNSADIADIKLAVTATDKDGDTAQGELNITINDGTDAVGGENIDITLTEGDRDVDGSGISTGGIDTTYPVEQSGQLTLVAGEDRLDPNTVAIDASQQADLIKELNAELTSGGHALTFTVDANGNLVGTLAGTDTVAVRVELTPQQDGQNVNVEVKIIQELPLDHKDSGNGTYVSVDGDDIAIKVPVQAKDTDGDPLDNPATIDITIKDGANPVFGIDSGITINETTEADKIIAGQIPLDVGSDDIQSIHFNAAQEGLANISSNGEATTYNVNGNVLTVVDTQSQPVMVVTIANDGTYTVKVTGPVDQNSADITEIKLGVTATDKDGDTAQGELNITINDGTDAVGGENIDITLTEGDRDVNGSGTSTGGIDTTYPVEQSGQLTLVAGEDRLDPNTVAIDASQQADLIKELNAELTSSGHALTFTVDANGNLVGTLVGTDTVAVRVELTPTQDGQNVNVEVKIIQELPLDHKDSGNGTYVSVDGDDIAIKVPVQAQDTDGDPLDNPATIDITIKDGANPVFGIDSGITINETTEADKIIAGQIPLDVGSDDIQSIHFNAAQEGLANISSNGEATTYNVNGNVLTVVDTQSQPVMVVTIANDGTYTVKVTGAVDQNSADIAEIKLAVTATDKDGDTAQGELNITINDGTDAVGGENIDITLTEGDRDVDGSGTSTGGIDTTYPVEQSGRLTLVAGEDRLDPHTVAIDASQQADLIKELNAELTSSGHALTFTVDANGNLVGTLVGTDTVAVRVELTPQQDGQNVNVDIKIIQALPLDHNASGDSAGFVTVNGNDIAIKVPVQAQDTDGDPLDNPATIDITIKDGVNPEFGIDNGTNINETTQNGQIVNGDVPLDIGSDDIQSIHFNAAQDGLANITSNGEATTYNVNGNVLTVIGSNLQPVMVVTIANDGTYTVKVTGAVDQNSADIAEIKLDVTATDKDGDTAQGELNITINDGTDAVGGENIDITLTEGDRDVDGSGTSTGGVDTTYPVEQSGQLTLVAGEDRLDPNTVAIDASQQADLIKELNAELTSSGHALTFTVDVNGNLVGTLAGTDTVAVRVELTPTQDGQNVNVEVKIIQELPLDHKDSGNGIYVSVDGNDIAIKVPVQAKDTDGDPLDNPATIDITIKDGANPVFGIDSGITINETTEADKIIAGQIPLDVGSDDIQSIHFNAAQDGLANITSNGEATTFTVNGNVLTVVDAQSQPVMVVTIANDGTYTVKVTGAVDQNSADIAEIKLAVTATDKDGDTARGELNITINDGTDAVGGENIDITLTEGDRDVDGSGTSTGGIDTTYPVEQSGQLTLVAGEDRLDPNTVAIDASQQAELIKELNAELTSSGHALTFTVDANGNLVGTLAGTDTVAVRVELTPIQDGQNVNVEVKIIQELPLDHNVSGDSAGFVTVNGNDIAIKVPVQAQDTDGDPLDNPATIDITIKDGANPVFGIDNGTNINETTQNGQIVNGDVPLDIGSDDIQSLHFNAAQEGLANITSNGEATTYNVNGNVLTVVDAQSQPVMVVTIANDGTYTVKVTGAVDQNSADIAEIKLAVTATDKDGDTAQGELNITINDGTDAVGGENIDITLTEGDRDVDGSGTSTGGIDTTYPVEQSGQLTLVAGEDRLDPNTVAIDASQQADLITELNAELTSSGHALTFTVDVNGNLVGTLAGTDTVAVRVELTPQQDGQNVNVEVKIIQELPLDHKDSGNGTYVSVDGDDIAIKVPVQAKDTDGDPLDNPATIDITIKDGVNPEFGIDNGTNINETTQNGQIVNGDVPLDIGSDDIQSIHFNAAQDGLANITSNGEATTYNVNGNVLTVVDAQSQPVMVVTIANDGTYTVKVTGPVDQNSADIADIKLAVTATDKDGDTAQGELNITINDGTDAVGGENIDITLTEGDRDVDGSGTSTGGVDTTYPVEQSGQLTLVAGEDRLDPNTVAIDASQQAALIKELNAELTSGGHALMFTVDANGNLVGTLAGTDTVAVRVELTSQQDGQNVNVDIKIIQALPLDHNASGDSAGFVTVNGNDIAIKVPVQAQDTDGDPLDNPATIDITIKDGANPVFGIDSGSTINETTEADKIIAGQIPLDVGSDDIQSIHFNVAQDGLANITSNGEATTYNVNSNVLTVVDAQSQPVMVVTIANDGTYTVKVTGPVDQNSADIAEIKLDVTATDKDGDTAQGELNITINDGTDAVGGENIDITLTEGDRDVDGSGTSTGGIDTTYPVEQSGQLTLVAGEDRLDPNTVAIDASQQADLIKELNAELTSGGHALIFTVDANGNLVGTLAGTDTVAVRVELTPQQDGQNVNVDIKIIQALPLDHNASGDSAGFVTVNGNDIAIKVPVQAQDTDGDPLDNPATIDITIKDGANPVFGIDSGTTITETETGVTATGKIPLDVGSDDIEHINFASSQPSLEHLISNNQETRYVVNGNEIQVVIDGGTNDGEAVLTITIANDGHYIVEQHQPIEQNNAVGDSVNIELGVVAIDDDGDTSNTGQLAIHIKDGLNPTGEGVQANIIITEGDLENPRPGKGYPVVGSGQFTVDATDDALVANSLTITDSVKSTLLTELNGLTSDGETLSFNVEIGANGVITITGVTATGGHEAVTITMTPSSLANGDVSVDMTIQQSLPLDHLKSNGTFVDVRGGKITISVPVQMQDTDGDALEKPVDVNITIKDGQKPSFGNDTSATLEEGTSGQATGSGTINVDTGSDQIAKVYFGSEQASLNGLTSNGHATSYHLSADGSSVIVVLQSDPSQVVMEVSIDIDGHYTVTQQQPIDQVDDKAADNENIDLNVYAQDHDGDVSKPGQITINIHDGNNAVGGETGSIIITEGDLTPATGQQGYPVSGDVNIDVKAGVDRLNPTTATIDSTKLTALIDELQSELTANGAKISFNYDHSTGVLTGTASGHVVITVTVSATQATNGHDADIKVSITQYSPLDHSGNTGGGLVTVDGDRIVIDVPVQIQDTDGDYLGGDSDNYINAQITINDGTGPVITAAPALTVEESDLASGSTPSGEGESALGDIIVNSGSDYVVDFKVDVDSFNQQNDITSNGNKITLSQSSEGTYQGIADGNVVFTYYLLPTGRYIFQLHGTIDHPTQGEDQLTIEIPVYAVDKDGDVSASVNIDVTVKDDIPSVENVVLTAVEGTTGHISDTNYGFVMDKTGADGAQVTSVTINGNKVALSDQNLSQSGFHEFDVFDGNQLLGQLFIKPDGQTIFRSNADLTHSQEEIIKKIGFEVTDGDGDTAQGIITIELSDQDTILHTENSIGEEDDGRHSTDPTDNVDPTRNGIAINMTIDGGDNDRGEHIGTVTIQPQTQAHGVFMYNGQPLTVNSDGSVTLPPAAFIVDNTNPPDVKFTLQGVTFVPDEDYSTSSSGIKFDVVAQINTTDGGNHPVMNGEFSVNVQGIADTPVWNASSVDHYVTTEDQNNVLLNVVADLQDTDGSEALFYFITVPVEYQDKCTLEIGGQLLTETSPGSGVYKVTVSQMASVEVNPVDNFSGDIKLTIQAQSKENSNFVDGHQFADSAEKTIIINVNPDADDGVLKVTRIEANEDQRIDLSSHISLISLDDNIDNSEHLFLQISTLPEGGVLYVNDQLLAPNADGVYEISYQDLNGLTLQPPLDSNVDFSITVNGVVRDIAQITDASGNVTTETSEKIIGPQTIDVALTGVVDRPEIVSDNPDWTPLDNGQHGLQTTIKEDSEATFDFKVISGEHTNADGNTDGSETLSVVISGIPEGTELYDSKGNLQTLVYAGEDSDGQPIYQVDLASLTDIVIKPPHNSTEDLHLDVRTVVTENDGASTSFNGKLVIHITPEIDANNYTTVSKGLEDESTVVNWQPSLSDSQEHITGLVLSGLPVGYQLFINGTLLANGGTGSVEFTDQQLQTLLDGGKLTVTAPHNSDQDIQLTSTVTVSQTDVDGDKETVTKDITGTLDVDIKAVVEPDGNLIIDDNGTVVTTISSSSNGVIDLSNDANSDGKIVWENDDTSSSEVITQIVLDPIPEGFVIIGGINNGDGSWTIPQSALNNLKIIAPEGYNDKLTLNINALVQDMSDDGDVSNKVEEKGTITLDFSANTETNDKQAADIIVDDNYIVTGDEDHSIDLGQQMMDHIVKVSTAGGEQVHDDFTLVINANDLPAGSSISGVEFNHVTGEYVLKVPVGLDGSIDLSDVKLNLPVDYAGDFKFDVKYVTTDTDSGDYKTQTDTIVVQVAPMVDGPRSVTIAVVETEGLNADKQPISTSDDKQEQVYDNIAYEDGDIKLDLSVSLKDLDTSETSGKETVQSVTLTLANTSDGVFIDVNGNVLGTSITVDQSQLDNIHFRPILDFSGKVDINVSTTVVDTAIYDQTTGATVTDSKVFDNTVSFDVIAVNDQVKWQGIDTPIVGDEDTAIPLAGISGSLEDIDGSEHIVSIKLENVPEGFVIEGAVNNGNGVWTITASGESFDLSAIKVQPPRNFSGNVDFDIVVYSQEASLDKPLANRETISINVNPIADKVDTDVDPNVSGDENSPITLDLGIQAFDDQKTINNPGTNVHENGAESLQITITNVPDSSSFTLPDGVVGSAEKQPDGSWIIKVTGSDLDTLIFHPGDANNQTVIDGSIWNGDLNLDIRAVDNGVVGTDSVAVDKTIHVDITPDNDAPVNHLPADPLTVDEDATLVIRDLQITDVDSNDHDAVMDMTVTLSVEHGQLAIAAGADVSGLTITDNDDGKLVIRGDLNLINTLLDQGINYTGDKDFNGTDSLTMTTDDNGNSGAGGALTDTDSIDITVTPVNDAPINTVPAPFDVNEDGSHVIAGLSIADIDAKESGTSGQMTVELNVEHGQLSIIAADTQGLTVTDNGDGKLVISGDIDKINTLLDGGIKYTGDTNFNGNDQLTMTTSDNGNVGSGGTLTDVSTVDIMVTPVNDAPINTVPAPFDVNEDGSHVIAGLSIADIDAKESGTSGQMTVELNVEHGQLSIIAADTQG